MKTHRLSGADTSSVTLVYIIRRGGTHHRFCRSASPFRTATPYIYDSISYLLLNYIVYAAWPEAWLPHVHNRLT